MMHAQHRWTELEQRNSKDGIKNEATQKKPIWRNQSQA